MPLSEPRSSSRWCPTPTQWSATAHDEGMLEALAPGSIWAQMSTIGVAGIERVAALVDAERPDITLVDAPVSGSKEPGRAG